VEVGKGVWVDVGGNQTVVSVGVMVAGIGVLLGNAGSGVEMGRQAAKTTSSKKENSIGIAIFICLVYYDFPDNYELLILT
jgi:hypothetical protein